MLQLLILAVPVYKFSQKKVNFIEVDELIVFLYLCYNIQFC